MKKLLLVLAVITTSSLCFAQEESAAALYNRANSLYSQGRYDGAIELYEKILSGGFKNKKIEYNLGNAYLKINPPDVGSAVLHYERARRIDPRDPDVIYNLKYVNSLIKGRLPEPETSVVQKTWNKLLRNITPGETVAVLSFSYLILTVSLIVYFIFLKRKVRLFTAAVSLLMLVLMLIDVPVLWSAFKDAGKIRAVVLEDETEARSGPGQDNPELFKLYEGMIVERHGNRSGWIHVTIPSGLSGWIPAEKSEEI